MPDADFPSAETVRSVRLTVACEIGSFEVSEMGKLRLVKVVPSAGEISLSTAGVESKTMLASVALMCCRPDLSMVTTKIFRPSLSVAETLKLGSALWAI